MTLSHADDDKVVMPDLIGHLITKHLREILRLGYLFFVPHANLRAHRSAFKVL